MDVENARIVDGLIFGYLSRQQYYNTLRVFCNEAPSLRDSKSRLQSGGDVFIQVNDQLHDKNLEQIVHAFSTVGRFDVTPELIEFGVRLRDLTNEFSTMTAMRGRSLSDNQIKLYGKKAYSKMHPARQSLSNLTFCSDNSPTGTCRPTAYCVAPISSDSEYVRQLHDNAVSANMEHVLQKQSISQQDLTCDYQQRVTSSYAIPTSSPYNTRAAVQGSTANGAQQSSVTEKSLLVDNGPNMKNAQTMEMCYEAPAITAGHSTTMDDQRLDISHAQMSSSFCSETGAHKRKAGVPHRRGDLVAHTAQSLIVPNGVLLDLESEAAASTTSQISLLSNIDDSAMQCLDRLINGNLDEVFPFCDDHDGLSEFAASLENPYPLGHCKDNEMEQESSTMCEESAMTPLDVGPSHSPPQQEHSNKSRSFDEGEIISDESNHVKTSKTSGGENVTPRTEERRGSPTVNRSESRQSSVDFGRNKRDEKRLADRLKEFNRNPPKPETKRSTGDLRDTIAQESKNIPLSSPTPSTGRTSRDRVRRFSALFDESHSVTSSRDSSPHRERLSKKEEERRRREKEMEKERQRDKERLRKQRRDRERSHRSSPERRASEKRLVHGDDNEKLSDSKEKEKKREQVEDRKSVDEAERKRMEEKSRREMLKKKKEEELEAKRQAEQLRRAEAMRRRDEENKRRRQEERERQEERRREEERQQQQKEERIRREEEKAQKRQEEGEEIKNAEEQEEEREQVKDEEEEEEEQAKSDGEARVEHRESEDDAASCVQHTWRNHSDEEESTNRKIAATQEQWVHPRKVEQRKSEASVSRSVENEPQLDSDQDAVPVLENDEKKRKNTREEIQSLKSSAEIRKSLPLPSVPPRREIARKAPAKPLEPGMMMSDPGVLDRINKEMESLTPRNRTSHNRSAEEPTTSSKAMSSSNRMSKRDVPVDYAQVLFSNAPVIKRLPPAVEKKVRNLVISSGLTTESYNQLVFSKAHSSRLGMFLEKVSDKHRKLMIDRDYDPEMASPIYEESDRNDVSSPFGISQCPRQLQKAASQKRPLPAASLDSYLGSPVQSSPDVRDGESSSLRLTSKKPKIDLSRMPDIIDKLYSNK